jgi:DNA-binding response OmpR family regulator
MDDGGLASSSEGSAQERHDALVGNTSPDRPRILVAEHDQSVADFLLAFLKAEGYEPLLALSIEKALESLDEQTFHLVLTDLFLENPRRPFNQVRRLLQHALPTPVGLMTGWQVTPEAVKGQGFAFLLSKPFDLDHILVQITTCLEPTLTLEQMQQFQLIDRFLKALQNRNLEALEQFVTEDITYFPPRRPRVFSAKRIRGRAAVAAYAQEASVRYQKVAFDGMLFYPRPKGWAMRFRSHWLAPGSPPQNLTGTLLIHFRGGQIHQIGVQWDSERLWSSLEH